MAGTESRRERILEELSGLGLLFLAVFFFLSFFSYHPQDPSFFTKGAEKIFNYGGIVGSYLSGLFFQSFGITSFLIFFLIFLASGYKLFKKEPLLKKDKLWLALRLGGIIFLLVFFSGFLGSIHPEISWRGEEIKTGGWIGYLLAQNFSRLFNKASAILIFGFGILASLVVGFNLSPSKILREIIDFFRLVFDYLEETIIRFRQRRKRVSERSEQKQILEQVKTIKEPKIISSQTEKSKSQSPRNQQILKPYQEKLSFLAGNYHLPSLKLLDSIPQGKKTIDKDSLLLRARLLEKKLLDFGVAGEVVEVLPGPVITMYEFKPASGVKVNKIANLADDLACALSALSVRIIAPLPGKGVVGIEIPNQQRETVYLKEIIASSAYQNSKSLLTLALGKNIVGEPFVIDLRKAPHLLVAGATGSGKSVSLNAMIMSVLFRATPDQVRMLLIDPKRLELSTYEGIPHLIHSVISEPKEAALALKWAVAEMERRYSMLAQYGARNIDSYNRLVEEGKKKTKKSRKRKIKEGSTVILERTPQSYPTEPLPLLLIVIDELADLMMIAARDCETSIARLAQMARAAGIHLIVATQRPSVDVITGLIKANFPARISFQVTSKTDSRTILDQNGAEKLLGMGDMLFMAPGTSRLIRVHGAYVSEAEIKRVASFWKKQGKPKYDENIVKPVLEQEIKDREEIDELYYQAVELVVRSRQASISMLQRKLRVGYNRAARMIERMEEEGIVGPADGAKPREVLIDPIQLEQIFKKAGSQV